MLKFSLKIRLGMLINVMLIKKKHLYCNQLQFFNTGSECCAYKLPMRISSGYNICLFMCKDTSLTRRQRSDL